MHPNVARLIKKTYAEQRSQEWLDLRKNMLTASDCATAIGENKYEKPFDLLLKKCGKGKPFTGNAATEHGNKYEDEARIIYEQRHNEVVHEIGLEPHPKYPCSVDHPMVLVNPENSSKLSVLCHVKFYPRYHVIICLNCNCVWRFWT